MLDKTFWADIYSQLSEVFKEPTREFADDVASGRLPNYFKEIFSKLGNDSSLIAGLSISGDVYTKLCDEYKRLFAGPLPPYIVPVESVYRKWTNDPECKLPIAGEKGYLMGDPAIDMIKCYQAHNIVIPEKYSSMPDHIALELEYMSFLCRNADIENQREFISNHLDWADELAMDIRNLSGNNFYSLCAKITAFIISRSKAELSS
ncbi:MAG: hypothetical protein C4550_04885 [Nitrospiraceae bacterium]|nr:MAG: hypothetical protein C4550_04885 [Nitrospiraceae bacterium]